MFHFNSLDIGKIIYLKILCTRHVKTFITSFTSLCLFIVNSFTLQDTYFLDKLLNRGLSTHNSLISNNSMQTSLTGVFLPLFYSFAISELSEFMFSFYSFSLTDVHQSKFIITQAVIYTEIYPYFFYFSMLCSHRYVSMDMTQ